MPWDQIFSWGFLMTVLIAGMRLTAPLLLAVLGETITERSGTVNFGLEGVMLMGGLASFAVTHRVEHEAEHPLLGAWLGLMAGCIAGVIVGGMLAILTISLRVGQVVAGVTLGLLSQGLIGYFCQRVDLTNAIVVGLPTYPIPILSEIPIVGAVLFTHNLMVYISVLLVPLCWLFLFQTSWGVQMLAVGENPASAGTAGINVNLARYCGVLIGSGLAGLGGAVLVVQLHLFHAGVIAGRGWIAIALVFFSGRYPFRAVTGALLFGVADAFQLQIQTIGSPNMTYGLLLLPYVLTLLALLRQPKRRETILEELPYLKGRQ